jgi:hypothetical protein
MYLARILDFLTYQRGNSHFLRLKNISRTAAAVAATTTSTTKTVFPPSE